MLLRNVKFNAVACALVLPLLLTACGSKPPKPCRENSREMPGDDMAQARKKADRYIKNETRKLKDKYKDGLTLKTPVTKCEEGDAVPENLGTLSKKDQKKAKKAAKPTCKVVIPYCIKIEGVPMPPDPKQEKAKTEESDAQG